MPQAPHVLIVDDDEALIGLLVTVLSSEGYRVSRAGRSDRLLDRLEWDRPDLVILDLNFAGADAIATLQALRAHPAHRDLPVLALAKDGHGDGATQALGLGASDFVAKPIVASELLARIRTQLRTGRVISEARAAARTGTKLAEIMGEIASLSSPAEIYQVLVRRLAEGLRISRCSIVLDDGNGETATVVAAAESPSLRHLTVELKRYPELAGPFLTKEPLLIPNAGADALFSDIRERCRIEGQVVPTTSTVVIPFTIQGQRAAVLYLRTMGADEWLATEDLNFTRQVVQAASPVIDRAQDFEETIRRREEMQRLADTDPLTGLFNRRAFRERLEPALERAKSLGGVLSCLMLDLDHFKQLNDTYGHEQGDQVLVQVADLLRREQRAVDVVARLGGEEFVMLLPETWLRGARIYAERILRRVGEASFGMAANPVGITVSIGIASYPDERVSDPSSLLRLADTNLLRAKADGRNCYRD